MDVDAKATTEDVLPLSGSSSYYAAVVTASVADVPMDATMDAAVEATAACGSSYCFAAVAASAVAEAAAADAVPSAKHF